MRIHAMLFDPGGVGFDDISLKMARPAFGHLAATRIARAEEQDF
jgi:hypothetical protein